MYYVTVYSDIYTGEDYTFECVNPPQVTNLYVSGNGVLALVIEDKKGGFHYLFTDNPSFKGFSVTKKG